MTPRQEADAIIAARQSAINAEYVSLCAEIQGLVGITMTQGHIDQMLQLPSRELPRVAMGRIWS